MLSKFDVNNDSLYKGAGGAFVPRKEPAKGKPGDFVFRTLVVCVRPDTACILGFARSKLAAEELADNLAARAQAGDVITTLRIYDMFSPPWWSNPAKLRERLVELIEETFP